jgi:hypothetical protein
MKAFTIRLAWIVIMAAFASMGALIILAGYGTFDIHILKAIGVTGATPDTNNAMIIVGYLFIAIVLVVSFLTSLNASIDLKDVPIKILSRVIIQNKVFLVADGKVFEKQTIEWTDIALHWVKREQHRNFYGTCLMEDLYIDLEKEDILELKTEDITNHEEFVSHNIDEELAVDDIIEKIEIGADDEQAEHQNKKSV